MNEVREGKGSGTGSGTGKRKAENGGREMKTENESREQKIEQSKFFVDLSKEPKVLERIFALLAKANDKSYGKEILFKDLAVFAIEALTDKDIEKLKDSSLTEMERVQRHLDDYNLKNQTSLSLGEFLVKKLNIT